MTWRNRRIRSACVRLLLAAVLTVIISHPALAGGNWLQWGGPGRDFRTDGTLLNKWPEEGPRKLWSVELGDGYSSVLVDGDTLYTMYTIRMQLSEQKWELEGQEVVVALNAQDGEKRWEYKYDAPWEANMQMEFGPGPHSTPLIVDDRVFAIGCTCKLHCLDKKTGKLIWAKDLRKEFDASHLMRGYGASPLAFEDTIILPIGGAGQGVIAFRQSDGSVAWKNQDFGPTYASPILIQIEGQTQLVIFSDNGASGLNPRDGSLLWNHAHKTQFDANISTPVWCRDNILFISSAYGNGARGIQIAKTQDGWSAKELWYNPKMKIHHGNAIADGNVVYGSSGDFGPAFMAAVDIHSGEFLWKQRGFTKATCVYGDKKLIVLDEDGNLALTQPTKKKLKTLSKTQVCKRIAWTVPTLADGKLYLRDRHTLCVYEVGGSGRAASASR